MTVDQARALIRSHFMRIHREVGPRAAGDFATAIETMIKDAIQTAFKDAAFQ